MADTYVFILTITKNGKPLDGFDPLARRVTVDESQHFAHEQASGAGYVALPVTHLDEIQVLVFTPSVAGTLRMNAQIDSGVDLLANGLLIALGVDLDSGAATNATFEHVSGVVATLRGFAGGT